MIRNSFKSCWTSISKRWATNMGGGSTTNGRDSSGKRLGVKMGNGTKCKTGQIIIRQRGFQYYPGKNVNSIQIINFNLLISFHLILGRYRQRSHSLGKM